MKRGKGLERPGALVYPAAMSEEKKVLVVEDEPDHRLAMQMIFEREEGLQVLMAGDTAEADAVLAQGPVDLILLDIALPGETGTEFCSRLKERPGGKQIPIIAVSAFPDTLWRDRALEAGCIDFVTKPFDPPKLIDLVRKTIGLQP